MGRRSKELGVENVKNTCDTCGNNIPIEEDAWRLFREGELRIFCSTDCVYGYKKETPWKKLVRWLRLQR